MSAAPSFGQWPDAPVERAESREDTRPIEVEKPIAPANAEPVEDTSAVEPAKAIEDSKPASSSTSGLRSPVRARKTSTQAHSVVGEFGVPPSSDSKPSSPIIDDEHDEHARPKAPARARASASPKRRSRPAPTDDDLDDTERTDEDPKPIAIEPTATEPPSKRSRLPVLIGAGLVATLLVAIVVGMQDRGSPEPSDDSPKPNRSDAGEPRPADVSERDPGPRPPGDTQTKLGDPDTKQPADNDSTTTEAERAETDTSDEEVDPRAPSVIPPGTPEENVKAFLKLPVSIHDGPPLGGIGRTGIHVDDITTGREYRSGECKDQVRAFSVATDKEVSVCFRVVHDRDEESVRVLWDKDGVTTRRGGVRIRDLHAYKTRAYLELRPEYVGTWRVRVISDDDVELAAFEFEIGP